MAGENIVAVVEKVRSMMTALENTPLSRELIEEISMIGGTVGRLDEFEAALAAAVPKNGRYNTRFGYCYGRIQIELTRV